MKGQFQIGLSENINVFDNALGDEIPDSPAHKAPGPSLLMRDKAFKIMRGQAASGVLQAFLYGVLDASKRHGRMDCGMVPTIGHQSFCFPSRCSNSLYQVAKSSMAR